MKYEDISKEETVVFAYNMGTLCEHMKNANVIHAMSNGEPVELISLDENYSELYLIVLKEFIAGYKLQLFKPFIDTLIYLEDKCIADGDKSIAITLDNDLSKCMGTILDGILFTTISIKNSDEQVEQIENNEDYELFIDFRRRVITLQKNKEITHRSEF